MLAAGIATLCFRLVRRMWREVGASFALRVALKSKGMPFPEPVGSHSAKLVAVNAGLTTTFRVAMGFAAFARFTTNPNKVGTTTNINHQKGPPLQRQGLPLQASIPSDET